MEVCPAVPGVEAVCGLEKEQGGKHKQPATGAKNPSASSDRSNSKWEIWFSLNCVKIEALPRTFLLKLYV